MSEDSLQLVRGIYRDWERGDFSSVDRVDPAIEFVPIELGPEGGVHRGLEAVD